MAIDARRCILLSAFALVAGCGQSQAPEPGAADSNLLRGTDTSRDFGDYVVYVNALMTDQLTPEIAGEYGIVRSRNRALLTFSVHRKEPNAPTAAVRGQVAASAVNLTGQLRTVALREIAEGEAIYYIGELSVNSDETLIYTIDVTPADSSAPLSLRYQKQFFVNR